MHDYKKISGAVYDAPRAVILDVTPVDIVTASGEDWELPPVDDEE